jgi:uncharacterized protein (TIGR03083 family)
VLHIGEVHRWATAVVANRAVKLGDVPPDFRGELPDRAETLEWFRAGAARLCQTLADADPTVDYAAFLSDPATPRLLFWARRQTMETGMHRVDAESAVGRRTAFAPDVAVDGIDEFLTGFLPRSRTPLRSDSERSLCVAPDYSTRRWTVWISNDPPRTEREDAVPSAGGREADCVLSGSASDIYLALWNRAPLDALHVRGAREVADLLCDSVQIKWG